TDSESAKAVVHGVVSGISMPFPVPNADACQHGNLECPLQSGQTYIYENEIEIRNTYPTVRADVKYELKDAKKENLACVLLPVKVV
ncbi:NPC intracellular cholesterol transporter 2-like, partial [Stegodyphus dumicola]|uniref:NPC intracellular cholesterol transporter 2-like n=1 Tax=Stegodyphus dumicola TaxID=202533 RepID=UPI0015AF2538